MFIRLLTILTLLSFSACSSTKSDSTIKGKTYGETLTNVETVDIGDLVKTPRKYEGKRVKVSGMVTDVCPKRGCWLKLSGKSLDETVRFKVQDGVMIFPVSAKGKNAVAEGVVSVRELSLEDSKKHAAYQAKEYGADIDPSSITEPMVLVQLNGTGAVIAN